MLSRVSDHASVTKKFKRLIQDCAYCGDAYLKARPGATTGMLTFDHGRPGAAGGQKDLLNGLLTCGPCNWGRKNVPLLRYLQGERGNYTYRLKEGTFTMERVASEPTDSSEVVEKRQAAFSRYLRFFVENRVRLSREDIPNGWFLGALPNLLFPFVSASREEENPFQKGVSELLALVAKSDPGFWLGENMKAIIESDFTPFPDVYNAFRESVSHLKICRANRLDTLLRFAGEKPRRNTLRKLGVKN